MAGSLARLEYKWKVLISIVFGIFMIILDSTVVNVAFQTLRREYGATLADAQWVISIYVLALGITTPMSGFLADRFGIKRMYIAGLSLFIFGSFLCGLAPSLGLLIAARALQGVGGGIAQPLGPALLYGTFPPKEQGVALGYFGIATVVAPALGPILGGTLVDAGHWKWIFFINIPIGIIGVTLASRLLRDHRQERAPKLDPLGLILAIVGFGSLLYATTSAEAVGWGASSVIALFTLGIVALIAFGIVELFVAPEPLLNLRLFKNRNFTLATLVGYVTVLALFGAEFLMPLYLQSLRGLSALQTGLTLLPLAITAGIAGPIAGRIYDRIGPRTLVVLGFSVLLINTWQLSQIQADTPLTWIYFLLALRGLALGLSVQTTFATALASVPRPLLPRGSALTNSTRFVVQSLAVAILATVLSGQLSPATRAFQAQAQEISNPSESRLGLCQPLNGEPLPAQVTDVVQQQRQNFDSACRENLAGFERAYHLTFYIAFAALILGALLPGWPFGWSGRAGLSASSPSAGPPQEVEVARPPNVH